ncbi:hypothetical protein CEXT_783301 [Caerostris extrusa]|uniref:Uncharacterized protein n=1 Tax=Caerostris extrusa TaxID=172846 RepID=A0AAV4V7S5_CAEEX|nr:hypothetical protein CEXT_783301 [Caerostris extrusa]
MLSLNKTQKGFSEWLPIRMKKKILKAPNLPLEKNRLNSKQIPALRYTLMVEWSKVNFMGDQGSQKLYIRVIILLLFINLSSIRGFEYPLGFLADWISCVFKEFYG